MGHFRHPIPCILGFQFFSSAALFDRFCTDCDHDANHCLWLKILLALRQGARLQNRW